MPEHKRQHWVPQSYLRRFSPDGAHVWLFDKPTARTALADIRTVAQGRYFYDGFLREAEGQLPPDVPESVFEREFGKWESALTEMTAVAQRVAAGGSATLQERQTMAICVAVQLARTRAFRKRFVEGVKGVLEDEANAFLAERSPDIASKFRVEITMPPGWDAWIHQFYIWQSGQIPQIALDLCCYIWRIGVNRGSAPLCTSDNPVISYLHDAGQPSSPPLHDRKDDVVRETLIGNRSIRGVELIFPLTPDVALLMFHPVYFAGMQEFQGRIRDLSEREVLHYNALQLLYSHRQFYASRNVVESVTSHAGTYTEILA